MKRIVSVSLGSSKRNHSATTEILGEQVTVERIGTDGDMQKAMNLVRELDGKVDAFGLGGFDMYVYAGGRRYTLRDGARLAAVAQKTPMADGSGLKNTLERRVVRYFDEQILPLRGKKVLIVSAIDRFGMAEALDATGADIVYGDVMFTLGIKWPVRSLQTIARLGRLLLPVVGKLPYSWLYPTGKKQEERVVKYEEYYQWADVIAGDFLYIERHAPERLDGKVILTNTVTPQNVEDLRRRGVAMLVTTTPNLGGRSFGTNLMEALICATAGRKPDQMTPADYEAWLDQIGFVPRVERLQEQAPVLAR